MSIAPGETVALLGPNGAGKSTTIDMMLGLVRPDAGSVSLFGAPPDRAVARGAVGAMLQTGGLIRELKVRELIAQIASLYPAPLDLAETMELVGIGDIADQLTQKLSGGQTQRVRFALAIVTNPDLLVLDEPTVAMDVESRHAFWTTMRAFAARGKTVLFATHYLEEADAYADRAVLMAKGSIVADGPTTEIKAMVGTRTIRATLPAVPLASLEALPGVGHVERRGEAVVLACTVHGLDRPCDRRLHGASLDPRRRLVPVEERRHARPREGAPLLLARASGPHRARRQRLEPDRVGGARGLDRRRGRAGDARLPSR